MSDKTKSQYEEIRDNMTEERKNEIQQEFLDIDPEALIVKRKEGLGFFEGLKADRESRKLAARQMGEIFVVMLETQKQIILQKCTLGLDIKKKELFLQYVHAAEAKNKEMFEMSANIEAALNDVLDQKTDQVDDMVYKRLNMLEERKNKGIISDEIYNLRVKDLEGRRLKQTQNLLARLDRLTGSHSKVFEQATEILKQRVISNNSGI